MNAQPTQGASGTRVAIGVLALWVICGTVAGLLLYLPNAEYNPEGFVFVALGLKYGAISGILFLALTWLQHRWTSFARSRGAITGLVSAVAPIAVDLAVAGCNPVGIHGLGPRAWLIVAAVGATLGAAAATASLAHRSRTAAGDIERQSSS